MPVFSFYRPGARLKAALERAREFRRSRAGRRLWILLKVTVGLGLLGLIGLHVDWTAFIELTSGVRPAWLLLILAIILADRVLMAMKWRYLLSGMGVQAGSIESVYYYFTAGLIGTATQWAPSGDIARAVAVGGSVGHRSVVVASVVLEKLGGLAASGCMATLSVFLLYTRYELGDWSQAVLLLGSITTLSVFVGLAAYWSPMVAKVLQLTSRVPWDGLKRVMAQVLEATELLEGRQTGNVFLALTLLEQLAPPVVLYVLSAAFGFDLTFVEILAVFPILIFLSRLPLSLDSFGVREALFVFLFGLIGVSTELSLALTLTDRVLTVTALCLGTAACTLLRRVLGTHGTQPQ